MSEARKIFPMDTFVAYLKGDGTASVAEMLGYLTQKDLDDDSTPFAAALAKAWIYEQHPELTKMSKGQMVELGQLDLQLAFGALCPLRKYVENQTGPVNHTTLQDTLKIALLCR